jgi:hypothetical protein
MTNDNETMRDQRDYVAYLVRLWRVSIGGATTWRASAECPHTGEQLGFAGVQDLFDFLSEQTGSGSHDPAEVSPGPGRGQRLNTGVADNTENGGNR